MSFLGRLSLQRKAALFITAVLVIVISLSTGIMVYSVAPRLKQSLLVSSTLIGQNLIKDIKVAVDLGVPLSSLDGVNDKLNQLVVQYPDYGYLYIADDRGAILYRSQYVEGKLTAAPAEERAVGHDDQTVHTLVQVGGQSFYDTSLPIISASKLVGYAHLGLKSQVVSSQINSIIGTSTIIGLVSFLLAALLINMFVNRFISSPLEHLAQTARRISAGELTPLAPSSRRDEIGQLAEAFRVMVEGLSSIVNQTRNTSTGLETSAGELSRVARGLTDAFNHQVRSLEEVVTSITKMDRLSHDLSTQSRGLSEAAVDSSSSIMETMAAIGEINHHMAEITATVDNISSAILEMTSTVRQVATGAENTAGMAEETRKAISLINAGIQNIGRLSEQSRSLAGKLRSDASETGARSMQDTLQGIHSIQEDVRLAEKAMQALMERVRDIGDIIRVIDDVADQTNLLALNASIISAQAGEHGRAFGVVASEIRELSVRTSDSTKKIAGLIKGVQGEADNYSVTLTRVIDSVVRGIALGQEAKRALETIVTSSDESAKMAGVIAQVTHEQAEASKKVSESVDVFTRSAEEIRTATREEAKGTEFIKDSMERAKQMVEMVYKATEEQNRGSKLIAETSEKAKQVSNELTMATETQRLLSTTIAKAVDSLKEITAESSRLIQSLNTSAELMSEQSISLKRELSRFRVIGPHEVDGEKGRPA